jgi:hypothetical protein
MGSNGFFLDPFGQVLPCNGSDERMIMGDLNTQTWNEIWQSQQAKEVRNQVKHCGKNCWMIGSVAPAMKQKIWVPGAWVVKYKIIGQYDYKKSNIKGLD